MNAENCTAYNRLRARVERWLTSARENSGERHLADDALRVHHLIDDANAAPVFAPDGSRESLPARVGAILLDAERVTELKTEVNELRLELAASLGNPHAGLPRWRAESSQTWRREYAACTATVVRSYSPACWRWALHPVEGADRLASGHAGTPRAAMRQADAEQAARAGGEE